MALSPKMSVPVAPGVHEEVSPHNAPPGTIVRAQNVRFAKSGEVQSRRGTNALAVETSADVPYSSVINATGPEWLTPCEGGFLFGAKGFGYRYDAAQGRVHNAGSYSHAVPHRRFATIAREDTAPDIDSIANNDLTPAPLSVATAPAHGYVGIVYAPGNGAGDVGPAVQSGGITCQIFTEAGTLVTTITADGSAAWIVYDDTSPGQFVLIRQHNPGANERLYAAIITLGPTGATFGGWVLLGVALQAAATYWAVCAFPGRGWALAYQSAALTVSVSLYTGTTASGPTASFATPDAPPLSLWANATNLYVGWVDITFPTTSKARVYSTALALTSGGTISIFAASTGNLVLTPPIFGPCKSPATAAFVAIGHGGVEFLVDLYTKIFRLEANGTQTSHALSTVYAMLPASAPFADGMLWVKARSPNLSTTANSYMRYLLLDFMGDRLADVGDNSHRYHSPRVACVGEAFASAASYEYRGGDYRQQLSTPVQMSSGHYLAGLPRVVRSEQDADSQPAGLMLAEWLEFGLGEDRQAAEFGDRECIVAGGAPVLMPGTGLGTLHYSDGSIPLPVKAAQRNGTDLGFFMEPALGIPTQASGAGYLTVGGVYQYRAVFEWIDGKGRRWRSRPSRVRAVTMTGTNNRATFAIDDELSFMRQHSGQRSSPSGIVWHLYRTVTGGSTFYRASPAQGAPLSAATSSYNDDVSDATLAVREVLYTDGGVLDNDHPPASRYVAVTEDRVWLGGLWDENQIQSSKVIVPGEPPQFSDSPAFRVVLPADCTGLATQDGAVVAFARSGIYAIQGSGPTDQGQGAWDSPREISRSTGCIEPRSIVETSIGIFFQSRRGIEILARGLGEPQLIGAPVQDSVNATGVTITGAGVVRSSDSATVRFCLSSGNVLIFDLDARAWSIDAIEGAVFSKVCESDGDAVLARTSIVSGYGFWREGATLTQDTSNGTPVPLAAIVDWAHLHPFGVAGQGRFNSVLGLFDGLNVGAGTPFFPGGVATLYATVDGTPQSVAFTAGASAPKYWQVVPLTAAGTAIQVSLRANRGGWRMLGWTIELEETAGARRMPAGDRG